MKSNNHANRGKYLERLIDKTNEFYRLEGIADIRKIPTPFKVLRQHERFKGLKVGHLEAGEWVDYVGIGYNKTYIFDAKQTKGKSLPLSNIEEHQLELLHSWNCKGAEAFLIVYFSDMDKYFRLPFKTLERCFKEATEGGRKSIPFKTFEEEAIELHKNISGNLFYL